jgi:F-type H+-transporting ATPase subunit k
VRNEYLALGTIFSTAALAFAATSGGGKKEATAKSSSIQESIQKAKESVPLNAKSR